jgi:hypothetical protein
MRLRGMEFAVYNRLIPAASELLATVQDGPEVPEHSAELKELLREYKDFFRSSLPDALPPQRDLEHEIETGDVLPVNTRACCLRNSSKSRRGRLLS